MLRFNTDHDGTVLVETEHATVLAEISNTDWSKRWLFRSTLYWTAEELQQIVDKMKELEASDA